MFLNDSLSVSNNISAADVKANGEIISKDTMRAEKDIIVTGNVKIAGKASVANGLIATGGANLSGPIILNGGTNINGGLTLGSAEVATIDPCIKLASLMMDANTGKVLTVSTAAILNHEDLLTVAITDPCASCSTLPVTIPTVPFTWQILGNHVGNNNRWLGTYENFDFNLKTHNTMHATFKSSGQIFFYDQVFIGTKKPLSPHTDAMLAVDGKVVCKSLYVLKSTSWADFVFEQADHEKLADVEKFVHTHKHLPGIPNEKDVLEKGYDLNTMDAKLLEKIENLYLHVIELEKEIELLKNK